MLDLFKEKRPVIFYIAAISTFLAGIYHFVGLFYEVNDATPQRHALFVGIDFSVAYLFLIRPKWFAFAYFPLLLQQIYTHGGKLYNYWLEFNSISWIDFFVLIAVPVFFINLVLDWRKRF